MFLPGMNIWPQVKRLLAKISSVSQVTDLWPILHEIASLTSSVKREAYLQEGLTFDGLQYYYNKIIKDKEHSFLPTVKIISNLALELENHLKEEKFNLCNAQQSGMLSINRQLVADLLAHSFLCLHPTKSRSSTFPEINFSHVFKTVKDVSSNVTKIRCFLKYFERIGANEFTIYKKLRVKELILRRVILENKLKWINLEQSNNTLCNFKVDHYQKIEEASQKYVRVDFANKYLGGGVLNTGCVQEEIMFTICPDLIVSMLFMEKMDENEAIIISGFERYYNYSGYGRTFKYKEDYLDKSPEENFLVAIDALNYEKNNVESQYSEQYMLRDINKAFIGFKYFTNNDHQISIQAASSSAAKDDGCDFQSRRTDTKFASTGQIGKKSNKVSDTQPVSKRSASEENLANSGKPYPSAIATGNWGCGAFNGDAQLKSMIQWISASEAGCSEMLYCTLNHHLLIALEEVVQLITSSKCCVGHLVKLLKQFECKRQERKSGNVFDFIKNELQPPKKQDVYNPSLKDLSFSIVSNESKWSSVKRLLTEISATEHIDNIWQLLSQLSRTVSGSDKDFADDILSKGLSKYYERLKRDKETANQFFLTVKAIAQYAINLDAHLINHNGKIQVIRCGQTKPLRISRQLVADIIAHSFFCLHVRKEFNFTNIYLCIATDSSQLQRVQTEKLKCILKYFFCLKREDSSHYYGLSNKIIHFQRMVQEQRSWEGLRQSDIVMGKLTEEKCSTIENTSNACAKVIFLKNTVMGANILTATPSCRQEEIFILSCPELLIGCFLFGPIQDKEAFIISDFDRYVSCDGIDFNFSCGEIVKQQNLAAIAINAAQYDNKVEQQYTVDCMFKDFFKAFVGFSACHSNNFDRNSLQYKSISEKTSIKQFQPKRAYSVRGPSAGKGSTGKVRVGQASTGNANNGLKNCSQAKGGQACRSFSQSNTGPTSIGQVRQIFKESNETQLSIAIVLTSTKFPISVATGSWGCGDLGGDPQLKAILQWIAMTEAGCEEMVYCTLNDATLAQLGRVSNDMKKYTVGQLTEFLEKYSQYRIHVKKNKKSMSLFDYWEKNNIPKKEKSKRLCSIQ